MKKYASLYIFFFFSANLCHAQKRTLDKDTSTFGTRPRYFLNVEGVSAPMQIEISDIVVNANDIKATEASVYTRDTTTYVTKNQTSVIKITLNPDVNLSSSRQLFEIYSIPKKDRTLKVYIDSTIAYHPANILFQVKSIKSVTVNKDNDGDGNYISIITIFLANRPKKGEFMVGGSLNKNNN